jgi:hypothetical protein
LVAEEAVAPEGAAALAELAESRPTSAWRADYAGQMLKATHLISRQPTRRQCC